MGQALLLAFDPDSIRGLYDADGISPAAHRLLGAWPVTG